MLQAKIKSIEIPSEIVTIISIYITPDENMLRPNFPFVFSIILSFWVDVASVP